MVPGTTTRGLVRLLAAASEEEGASGASGASRLSSERPRIRSVSATRSRDCSSSWATLISPRYMYSTMAFSSDQRVSFKMTMGCWQGLSKNSACKKNKTFFFVNSNFFFFFLDFFKFFQKEDNFLLIRIFFFFSRFF